jgi:hypothetical protein
MSKGGAGCFMNERRDNKSKMKENRSESERTEKSEEEK